MADDTPPLSKRQRRNAKHKASSSSSTQNSDVAEILSILAVVDSMSVVAPSSESQQEDDVFASTVAPETSLSNQEQCLPLRSKEARQPSSGNRTDTHNGASTASLLPVSHPQTQTPTTTVTHHGMLNKRQLRLLDWRDARLAFITEPDNTTSDIVPAPQNAPTRNPDNEPRSHLPAQNGKESRTLRDEEKVHPSITPAAACAAREAVNNSTCSSTAQAQLPSSFRYLDTGITTSSREKRRKAKRELVRLGGEAGVDVDAAIASVLELDVAQVRNESSTFSIDDGEEKESKVDDEALCTTFQPIPIHVSSSNGIDKSTKVRAPAPFASTGKKLAWRGCVYIKDGKWMAGTCGNCPNCKVLKFRQPAVTPTQLLYKEDKDAQPTAGLAARFEVPKMGMYKPASGVDWVEDDDEGGDFGLAELSLRTKEKDSAPRAGPTTTGATLNVELERIVGYDEHRALAILWKKRQETSRAASSPVATTLVAKQEHTRQHIHDSHVAAESSEINKEASRGTPSPSRKVGTPGTSACSSVLNPKTADFVPSRQLGGRNHNNPPQKPNPRNRPGKGVREVYSPPQSTDLKSLRANGALSVFPCVVVCDPSLPNYPPDSTPNDRNRPKAKNPNPRPPNRPSRKQLREMGIDPRDASYVEKIKLFHQRREPMVQLEKEQLAMKEEQRVELQPFSIHAEVYDDFGLEPKLPKSVPELLLKQGQERVSEAVNVQTGLSAPPPSSDSSERAASFKLKPKSSKEEMRQARQHRVLKKQFGFETFPGKAGLYNHKQSMETQLAFVPRQMDMPDRPKRRMPDYGGPYSTPMLRANGKGRVEEVDTQHSSIPQHAAMLDALSGKCSEYAVPLLTRILEARERGDVEEAEYWQRRKDMEDTKGWDFHPFPTTSPISQSRSKPAYPDEFEGLEVSGTAFTDDWDCTLSCSFSSSSSSSDDEDQHNRPGIVFTPLEMFQHSRREFELAKTSKTPSSLNQSLEAEAGQSQSSATAREVPKNPSIAKNGVSTSGEGADAEWSHLTIQQRQALEMKKARMARGGVLVDGHEQARLKAVRIHSLELDW